MENIYSINVVPTYSPGAYEHPGHGIDAALPPDHPDVLILVVVVVAVAVVCSSSNSSCCCSCCCC